MQLFLSKNKILILIWGIAILSLAYVSIYYRRPWFIVSSVLIVGGAVFYADSKKTHSLQDIGLGAFVGVAFLLAVGINTFWANILILTHILNPSFYMEYSGNYFSFGFIYHFIIPLFILFILLLYILFPGEKALESACSIGDVERVKKILDIGIDPEKDIPPYHNRRPISIAVRCNHLPLVKYLVELGVSTHGCMQNASECGHFEILKYLLENGADPDSGLYGAIKGKQLEVVEYLLENGAGNFDFYRLAQAFEHADSGDDEILKLLLNKRPDWEFPEEDSIRLIECAIKSMEKTKKAPWSLKLLEILFSGGLDANAHDSYQNNGLLISAQNDNYDAVSLFIKKGAQVNNANNQGETALMKASCWNGDTRILQILMDNGADPDLQDMYNVTALMRGNRDKIKFLLSRGADVCIKDSKARSAIHCLWSHDDVESAELFLKHGADINEKDNSGMSPLMIAAGSDSEGGLVAYYLNNGSEINATDNSGKTALMHAACHNHENSIKLLLENGADRAIVDNAGKKAVDYSDYMKELFL